MVSVALITDAELDRVRELDEYLRICPSRRDARHIGTDITVDTYGHLC